MAQCPTSITMIQRVARFSNTTHVTIGANIGIHGILMLDSQMPRLRTIVLCDDVKWTPSRVALLANLRRIETLDHTSRSSFRSEMDDSSIQIPELPPTSASASTSSLESSLTTFSSRIFQTHNLSSLPQSITHLFIHILQCGYGNAYKNWIPELEHHNRLTHIGLNCMDSGVRQDMKDMCDLYSHHPCLEHLHISSLETKDANHIVSQYVLDERKRNMFFGNLRDLKIGDSRTHLLGEILSLEFKWLIHLAALTSFQFSPGLLDTNKCALEVVTHLPPSLTHLDLENCDLPDKCIGHLPTQLRSLNISRNRNIHHLSSLSRLTCLETLRMNKVILKDTLHPIPSLTHLEAEDVYETTFSINLFPLFPRLASLHIPATEMSYHYLCDLPCLTSLHLPPQHDRPNSQYDFIILSPLIRRLVEFKFYSQREEEEE